jgi:hypothetical protein
MATRVWIAPSEVRARIPSITDPLAGRLHIIRVGWIRRSDFAYVPEAARAIETNEHLVDPSEFVLEGDEP